RPRNRPQTAITSSQISPRTSPAPKNQVAPTATAPAHKNQTQTAPPPKSLKNQASPATATSQTSPRTSQDHPKHSPTPKNQTPTATTTTSGHGPALKGGGREVGSRPCPRLSLSRPPTA